MALATLLRAFIDCPNAGWFQQDHLKILWPNSYILSSKAPAPAPSKVPPLSWLVPPLWPLAPYAAMPRVRPLGGLACPPGA